MLDEAVRSARIRRAAHVALKLKVERALFASDGFHPSPAGYAAWGEELGRVAHATFFAQASSRSPA
jgi:lysophospholipase L1-like esterase